MQSFLHRVPIILAKTVTFFFCFFYYGVYTIHHSVLKCKYYIKLFKHSLRQWQGNLLTLYNILTLFVKCVHHLVLPPSRRARRWRRPCPFFLSRRPRVIGSGGVCATLWPNSLKRLRSRPSLLARGPQQSTRSPWAHCWTSPTLQTHASPWQVRQRGRERDA